MKNLLFAALLALVPAIASADPVFGVWKTQVDDDDPEGSYAYVDFHACGAVICGSIARSFDKTGETQSENKGKNLVWDMQAQGNGRYGKGKVWQPSTDKVFSSKMTLDGNTLYLKGCIGPFCKTQTWTRVQ